MELTNDEEEIINKALPKLIPMSDIDMDFFFIYCIYQPECNNIEATLRKERRPSSEPRKQSGPKPRKPHQKRKEI